MIYYYVYKFEIAELTIIEEDNYLIGLFFNNNKLPLNVIFKETDFIIKVKTQLTEYFKGERKVFDIPLKLNGTDFQKKVWSELTKIPYGQTCSYREIAEKIGNNNAQRAVGLANNKNKIAIIIPCHRVIGKNGSLTGYAGGLDLKTKLLNLEKLNC